LRQSFRSQLIGVFAALLFLSLAAIVLFYNWNLSRILMQNFTSHRYEHARLLAEELENTSNGDYEFNITKQTIINTALLNEINIYLFQDDQNVLIKSESIPITIQPKDYSPAFSGTEVKKFIHDNAGNPIGYLISLPIQMADQQPFVLVVTSSLTSINKLIQNSWFVGSIIALLLFLVSLAVVVRLINTMVRPLQELSGSISQENADLSISIPDFERSNEIGQLERGFRQLTEKMDKQIQELTAEQQKFLTILSNMTDGLLILDGQGFIQLINPEGVRIFAIEDEGAALNRPLIEVARHHQLVELWKVVQASGQQQSITFETGHRRLFLQAVATPLTQSIPGGTLMLIQDLTQIRRLEVVRRDFVSNVSHELRTPIASLKLITETLVEGAIDDTVAAHRFLILMEHEIDNLAQMVEELLELSRIESGRVPIKRKKLDPCEVMCLAVERMQLQAQRAGISLRLDCPDNLPKIFADDERISHVFINLLSNAIKFTPEGGEIVVAARQEVKRVIFSVHDSGVGIPQEDIDRIFERFYKVDRARSSGGTGLGLSIAKHTVEAHKGQIWAESAEGQGSTFYFSLPIAD
jgi:two-component system phosphate regulon sensor histidine kinase PhoR